MQSVAEISDQARVAASARDWSRAAELWGQVAAADPDNRDALIAQADALREGGRMPVAEQVLATARERFPDDYAVAVASARNAAWMRDWPLAIARWQAVQAIKPEDAQGMLGEADVRRDLGYRAGAEARDCTLLERNPDAFWPYWGYARTATIAGDWEAAIMRWRMIQERFPNSSVGFVGEIDTLREAGRIAEAERLLPGVIARYPGDHWAATSVR